MTDLADEARRPLRHLDHAATSSPKPRAVIDATCRTLETLSGNPGRGSGMASRVASVQLEDARRSVAGFLGASDPASLAFTMNATDALNMALKGLVREGVRVLASPTEHAAVERPLATLVRQRNVEILRIPVDPWGRVLEVELLKLARSGAALAVISAASNVTGAAQPLARLAALLADLRIPLLVDAAQGAGPLPLSFDALGNRALLAFTGHKGLLGPMGAGGLLVGRDVDVEPWREGGTGDGLDAPRPREMPLRLEAGTPPLPAIAGLAAGVAWLQSQGCDAVREREQGLARELVEGLATTRGVRLPADLAKDRGPRVPLASFLIDGYSPAEASMLLESEFGVTTRAGLHCAPAAHRWLGTWPEGTLRASLGPTSTADDVAALLEGVRALAAGAGRG